MQIQPSQSTNFQSRIKFIEYPRFLEKTKKLNKKHEIKFPWSPNEIKRDRRIFTLGIKDCIAGGLIDDGRMTGFHLCTLNQQEARRFGLKAFNIAEIERRLTEKTDMEKDNLHGFIIGGFQTKLSNKYNVNKLNKIKAVFEKYQIPYTVFGARKDVHKFGKFGFLYDGKEDTIYITNSLSGEDGYTWQDKEIQECNNVITYHTYKWKKGLKRIVHHGTLKDFMESQFRQVSICKLDEFA